MDGAGVVTCWGFDSMGRFETGASGSRSSTSVVMNLPEQIVSVVSGASTFVGSTGGYVNAIYENFVRPHVCALGVSGQIYCWGFSDIGQLGNRIRTLGAYQSTPVKATGISGATKLLATSDGGCATDSAGKFLGCWGSGAAIPAKPMNLVESAPSPF